jgi:hypothetical protein
MRIKTVLLASVLGGLAGLGAGCSRPAATTGEVVAIAAATVPLDPQDRLWRSAPEHVAALLLQDLVEPRLMAPSTAQVKVRAMTDGAEVAFRLEWQDATADDLPGPGHGLDGCAVQLPRKPAAAPPAPQMGELGAPVEIVFWRADWQASVDGRPDELRALYPYATVDHYPFQAPSLEPGSEAQRQMAKRFAPAEALGARRVGPRETPVEDLVAEGPGTLGPAPRAVSRGKGVRTKDGWSVVLRRPIPEGLAPGKRTQVAFAVWEGSHGEAGARKMRTGWIPLFRRPQS